MSSVLSNTQTRTLIDEVEGKATPHEEGVLSWRECEFLRMQFAPHEALALARTRIDLHDMQDLLDAGCPHSFAWRILLDTCFAGEDDFDYSKPEPVVDVEDDGA